MDTQHHLRIRSKKERFIKIGVILAILALIGIAAGVAIGWWAQSRSPLPASITDQLTFTPHFPTKFPTGYQLDQSDIQVEKGVLIYRIKNTRGHSITLTEQTRPTNQNFDNFYMQNIVGAERLENVRNQSVLGGLPGGGYILSVLTDSTWLLISTTAPNGKAALRYIAQYMPRS